MGNSLEEKSKTIKVITEFGEVEVRRMPLKDYAELLRVLENIPDKAMSIFNKVDDDKIKEMSNVDYIKLLPVLIAESWEDIIDIIAIPTDKDAQFLGKLDLADAVDVVAAILELNDIQRIISAIKKVVALKAKIQRNPKQ